GIPRTTRAPASSPDRHIRAFTAKNVEGKDTKQELPISSNVTIGGNRGGCIIAAAGPAGGIPRGVGKSGSSRYERGRRPAPDLCGSGCPGQAHANLRPRRGG